jgi:hypothetical protein
MRTYSLLVLAPIAAVAIACGGGNSNDNPAVPTVDMSDAGSSMDTSMMDAAAAMPATDTSMAMDASVPSTDTSMTAMDAAAPMDTAMDAGKPAKKGKKKKSS